MTSSHDQFQVILYARLRCYSSGIAQQKIKIHMRDINAQIRSARYLAHNEIIALTRGVAHIARWGGKLLHSPPKSVQYLPFNGIVLYLCYSQKPFLGKTEFAISNFVLLSLYFLCIYQFVQYK